MLIVFQITIIYHLKARLIRKKIKKILIYFGASDRDNNTLKILDIIKNKKYSNYKFKILIGIENKNFKKISKLADLFPWIDIQKPLKSLADLILESDIFIGAGGTNTWERLILGLPSLVIPIAKNQNYLCENLKNISLISVKDKEEDLEKWINLSLKGLDKNIKKLSKDSMVLIDGYGTSRICNSILGTYGPLKLKKFKRIDKSLLFNLVNEIQVRGNSFNKNQITIDTHSEWFDKSFENKNTLIYIAFCINKSPVGQIRFDIKNQYCFLDFSIDKTSRGYGFGYEIVEKGIKKIRKTKLTFKYIIAEVLSSNISSIKIFRKLGFSEKYQTKTKSIRFYKKNQTL